MVFLDGLFTGLILQVAIGPVFFYILSLAFTRSLPDAYAAICAAVLVDYLYITLAILGVGKALENQRIKTALGLAGAVILVVFGWLMVQDPGNGGLGFQASPGTSNLFTSFLSTFLLTISSPLTIIFWTGVFASKALERGYSRKDLVPFGIAAGLATLIFMGISITALSYLKYALPVTLIQVLNRIVGGVLILYGLIRLGKMVWEYNSRPDTPSA